MKKNQFSVVTLCLVLLTLLVVSVETTFAIPAYPFPVEYKQPDGTVVTVQLRGDEFIRNAYSVDGYTLMLNSEGGYEYAILDAQQNLTPSGVLAQDMAERSFQAQQFLGRVQKGLSYSAEQMSMLKQIEAMKKKEAAAKKAFPTSGSRKLVCVLIGFQDLKFTKTKKDFDNLFNQVNYSTGGASGSVKDYYAENSHGKLDLSVTVAGPYVAANKMSYYGGNNVNNNDANPRALASEAVKLADADVDYADFDNDGDGSVDGIYVIYAGYGEEAGASSDAIWAHAWSFPTVILDGKRLNRYSCSAELRGNRGSGISRIGVICHEFGHVLGAPDYYDTNYGTGGRFSGTGSWDIMAGGSWNNGGATPAHHNVYTKVKIYNWATAKVLSSKQKVTLKNVVDNNTGFYQINTKTKGEYFIIENRQQKGFDLKIPGHGMMIYHVHSGVGAVGNSINATYPQRMYPVCASASEDPNSSPSSYGSINSGGCPFPGTSKGGSFTDTSTPSSKSWAKENTEKPITNIKESNGVVTFDFMGNSTVTPVAVTGVVVSPTSVSLKVGATKTLAENVSPANASDQSVTWTSDDTSVATVDSNGVVMAVATGSAIITVTTVDGGFKASSKITVKATGGSATGDCGDYGVSYVDDNTIRIYHKDEGWSADWNYLCLDGFCLQGIKADGYFYKDFSATLGQTYTIEFKVQTAVQPGQYLAPEKEVTFTRESCTFVNSPSFSINKNLYPSIAIYPNPVVDELHISGVDSDVVSKIIDLSSGKTIKEGKGTTICVSNLKSGVYMLKTVNKQIKFVKE